MNRVEPDPEKRPELSDLSAPLAGRAPEEEAAASAPAPAGSLEDLRPPRPEPSAAVSESAARPRIDLNGSPDAVVPAARLLAVASWSDLEELYRERGESFSSDDDLMAQVRRDWALHLRHMIGEAQQQEGPGAPYVVECRAGVKPLVLVGVVHSIQIALNTRGFSIGLDREGVKYFDAIRDQLIKFPFPCWLSEHKLTSEFLPVAIPEITDHMADGAMPRLARELKSMWVDPARRFLSGMGRNLSPAAARGPENQAPRRSYRELLKHMTHLPPDALYEQPLYIKLLWQERNGIPLSRDQRRSAYQAEFLKTFDPKQAYGARLTPELRASLPAGALERTGFVCGAGHVPEIRYFLEHGVPDTRLAARARRDAELLNRGIDRYAAMTSRREAAYRTFSYGVSIAIGGGAGYGLMRLASALF